MCVEILFNNISSVIYHSLGDSPSVTNVLYGFWPMIFLKLELQNKQMCQAMVC
jgi:hypothetical protein